MDELIQIGREEVRKYAAGGRGANILLFPIPAAAQFELDR